MSEETRGLKAYYASLKVSDTGERETFGQIPATSIEYTEILNAPGSFSVNVPLKLPEEIEGSFTMEDVSPGRTLVVIEKDNTPVFAGIVWGLTADVNQGDLRIAGLGVLSYFRKRYLKTTKIYNEEQTSIVAKLIEYAQTGNGNIGVDTSRMISTGRVVQRGYPGYELHEIGKLIESFHDNQYGFDTIFYVEKTAGGYQLGATNTTSRLGRKTDIVFDLSRGANSFSVTVDGDDLANNIVVTGSGEGSARVDGTASDSSLLTAYPVLERVEQATDDTVRLATLTAKARASLARRKTPSITPTLSLSADREPALGEYRIGDRVRVRGNYGMLNIDAEYKLMEVGVRDSNGSPVTVSVKLEPLTNFED